MLPKDILEALRLERHQLGARLQAAGGLLDNRVGDGAHVAELLRQDEVRLQGGQAVGVKPVDAAAIVDQPPDVAIDVQAGTHRGQDTRRDHRPGPHGWRVIAFVGDGHEVILQAERANDLGRARKEGGDPHR